MTNLAATQFLQFAPTKPMIPHIRAAQVPRGFQVFVKQSPDCTVPEATASAMRVGCIPHHMFKAFTSITSETKGLQAMRRPNLMGVTLLSRFKRLRAKQHALQDSLTNKLHVCSLELSWQISLRVMVMALFLYQRWSSKDNHASASGKAQNQKVQRSSHRKRSHAD